MDISSAGLLEHLFKKDSLDAVSDDQIQDILSQYPFFAQVRWIQGLKNKEETNLKEGVYAYYPNRLLYFLNTGKSKSLSSSIQENTVSEQQEATKVIPEGQNTEEKATVDEVSKEESSQELLPNSAGLPVSPTAEIGVDKSEESLLVESSKDPEHQSTAHAVPQSETNQDNPTNASTENQEENRITQEESSSKPPLFQPLYTEDYFAYTKEKLPEKMEDDKPPTMEQVRSFTGWLKTMKNVHHPSQKTGFSSPEKAPVKKDGEEVSLSNQVVTESMARIWEEHGLKERAIEVYEQLILLNPEKKSYFASKIKALKEE